MVVFDYLSSTETPELKSESILFLLTHLIRILIRFIRMLSLPLSQSNHNHMCEFFVKKRVLRSLSEHRINNENDNTKTV